MNSEPNTALTDVVAEAERLFVDAVNTDAANDAWAAFGVRFVQTYGARAWSRLNTEMRERAYVMLANTRPARLALARQRSDTIRAAHERRRAAHADCP